MKIDDAIDKLNAAYKRLDEPQGRIARSNARNGFLGALRALRKGLDDEYPMLPKPPKRRRRKRNAARSLRNKTLIGSVLANQLLLAGVSKNQMKPGPQSTNGQVWAPRWMVEAHQAGFDHKRIAEAVRSQPKRRRIKAMLLLGKTS